MFCRNCGRQTDETKTGYCDSCKQPLGEGVYAPPQGYAFDKSCGLYYQSSNITSKDDGAPMRRVIWFNPHSGEYQVSNYPQSQIPPEQQSEDTAEALLTEALLTEASPDTGAGVDSEPKPQAFTAPEPQAPAYESARAEMPAAAPEPPQPVLQPIQPPAGFVQDSATGLYYRAVNTGEGWAVTWFNPESNSYTQQQYPLPEARQAAALTSDEETAKPQKSQKADNAAKNGGAKGAGGNKRKKTARAEIILLALVLLAGGGAAAWYFGLLDGIIAQFTNSKPASQPLSQSAPSSVAAPSSSQSAPSSAPLDYVEIEELPMPEGFELAVYPISPSIALIRMSGINFEQEFPANFPHLEENYLIYEWSVSFGDYYASILVANSPLNSNTIRITDFTPTVWYYSGHSLSPLEGATVEMDVDNGVMEWLITMPEPTPYDFTTGQDYSYTCLEYDKFYYTNTCTVTDRQTYTETRKSGLFITPDLPFVNDPSEGGDVTGYVDNYDWYGHDSVADPGLPNGKWMTNNGERVVYLDHPVNLGTVTATIVMTYASAGDYRAISCKLIRYPGESRFIYQSDNGEAEIWIEPLENNRIEVFATFGGTSYGSEIYELMWTTDK